MFRTVADDRCRLDADRPSRVARRRISAILTVMIVKAVHAMFRRLGRLAGLTCAGWLVACAPTPQPLLVDEGEPVHTIYVFSNGWHTSIVVSRDALPPGRSPKPRIFHRPRFLSSAGVTASTIRRLAPPWAWRWQPP